MTRRQHLAAAGRSFLRVLAACVATAYAGLGKASPLDLTRADLRPFAAALLGALALTVVNWARAGDTRFGTTSRPSSPEPATPDVAPPPLDEAAYGPDSEPLDESAPATGPVD